jgi:hypothetical protein
MHKQLQRTSLGLLNATAALQLFRQKTGVCDPPLTVAKYEKEIIDACGGLPLALRITGARLFKEDGSVTVEQWEVSADKVCLEGERGSCCDSVASRTTGSLQ